MVSVVIPCLNEVESIARCLDSLIDGGYPLDQLEVLVVDGGSTDGTRAIVEERCRRFPCIKLLENPRRTQQAALNIGIRAAKGDPIIRMDGHAIFSPGYIGKAIALLESSGADNVGGRLVTVPRRNTAVGRAIAAAMSVRFGVGNSDFRTSDANETEPRWASTVPYSCYRRDVFERVGLFNEALDKSEDAEFHQRMREYGCRTLFAPVLVSYYAARSDFRSFVAHTVDNGRWAVIPTLKTGRVVVSAKHLTPLVFLVTLLTLGALSLVWPFALKLLVGIAVTYGLATLAAATQAAVRRSDPSLVWMLPPVFLTLHLGYGLGSLLAILSPITKMFSRPPAATGAA